MAKKGKADKGETALPATVREYLKHLKRLGRADSTLANVDHILGVLDVWLCKSGMEIEESEVRHLESFQEYLGKGYSRKLSKGSIANYLAIIKGYYAYLVKERRILASPASKLVIPKSGKRVHRDILNDEEILSLINAPDIDTAMGLRDAVALRLMTLSGLRRGDIINLNLTDINIKDREIIIRQGKGKRDRVCFFDISTRTYLARYILQANIRQAVFMRENGSRVNDDTVSWLVERARRRAKIKRHITPHSLRRTFCNLLLRSGCNIKVIAELAGHRSLSTTTKYTRVNISELSAIYHQTHPRSELNA